MEKFHAKNYAGIRFSHSSQEKPYTGENHCHDCYELLYVIDGRGRYIVEGIEYEMHPGSMMLIYPFKYHYVDVGEEMPYERYILNFSLSNVLGDAAPLISLPACEKGTDCFFFPIGTVPESVRSAFERFCFIESLSEESKDLFAKMLLSELLILLSSIQMNRIEVINHDLGARVIRYLNENLEKNISLDRIARHFFVSKYYLCRAFKKHNGISIHGYITNKRVMYAKQLIESGESASGAAYRVGFGDYSAFYRAYVKLIGTAPMKGKSERRNDGLSDS